MTIVVDDKLLGIWHMEVEGGVPPKRGNVLGGLVKEEEGYKFLNRIRIYVDDKAHDSQDIRDWHEVSFNAKTLDDAIKKCRLFFLILLDGPGLKRGPLVELLRGELTTEEFAKEISALPSMHTRKESVH